MQAYTDTRTHEYDNTSQHQPENQKKELHLFSSLDRDMESEDSLDVRNLVTGNEGSDDCSLSSSSSRNLSSSDKKNYNADSNTRERERGRERKREREKEREKEREREREREREPGVKMLEEKWEKLIATMFTPTASRQVMCTQQNKMIVAGPPSREFTLYACSCASPICHVHTLFVDVCLPPAMYTL